MQQMTTFIAEQWKNNSYYDRAESEEAIRMFWGEDSIFLHLFRQLNPEHMVELACGHGRHVRNYVKTCKTLTLIDIHCENIDFCKARFKKLQNIDYLVNKGTDFTPIEANSKTAIFTYDAMVHFELHDIMAYLHDAHRILQPGGRILWHHSNYAANPGGNPYDNPGGRNFMSADLFAHLAIRAGFLILSQNIIHWSKHNLDCVSLCQKRA